MDSDVQASAPLAATGEFQSPEANDIGRCRVRGAYVVCGASAGDVVIADGVGGTTLITVDTPTVANGGAYDIQLPGRGVVFQTGPHGTVTNTAAITLFYEGG
jgi:hypothetical protein